MGGTGVPRRAVEVSAILVTLTWNPSGVQAVTSGVVILKLTLLFCALALL